MFSFISEQKDICKVNVSWCRYFEVGAPIAKNKGIDAEMKIIENSIFRYLDRISMSNTKEIRMIENLLERFYTLDI